MADRAHVTSIDALEDFRSRLVIYLEKATLAANELGDDIARTRIWLEQDRRPHWQNELRQRLRQLEMAEQELFTARLALLGETLDMKQMLVRKAKQKVEEAHAKLAAIKKWERVYDAEVQAQAKQIERLRGFLGSDLREGLQRLTGAIEALQDYSRPGDLPVSPVAPGPAPGGTPEGGVP